MLWSLNQKSASNTGVAGLRERSYIGPIVFVRSLKSCLHPNAGNKWQGIVFEKVNSYSFTHLSEFHLIHSLSCIPMKERFSSKHGCKLLAKSFEQFLDGRIVPNEGTGHFQTFVRYITDSRLHVIRNPLDEKWTVFVLDVQDLLVNFLHGHAPAINRWDGEVATMTGVASGHHVFGVEHLLGKLRHGQRLVLGRSTGNQRGKTRNEKMKARKGHHVNGQLP